MAHHLCVQTLKKKTKTLSSISLELDLGNEIYSPYVAWKQTRMDKPTKSP